MDVQLHISIIKQIIEWTIGTILKFLGAIPENESKLTNNKYINTNLLRFTGYILIKADE